MTSVTKCGACEATATLVCGGCGDISYCRKECQKSHWKKGHKSSCKAYKIEIHPEQGRFLVASRQLKAGSRIVTKLKPSVVGPPLTNPSNPELPLNFLKLKNSDPELFEKLLNLESHVEEVKESVMWPEYQKGIVEPLTKMDFDEDLVCQIIGIICTNSFELLQPTKGAPQHGLFETASLMNHDCIGNTRLVIDETKDGFQMSIYASVQISKGAPILFNYVRPLDTHVLRKENLYNFKYFTCKCKRCEDPTELNTFNSAYLCPTCQTGPVVKIGEDDYACHDSDCQAKFDKAKANHIDTEIEHNRKKLSKIQQRVDLKQAIQINSELERLLYPSHGFMLEIKQALITCTAAAINNPGPSFEPQMQQQRIEWCDQVLDSLNILEPGLSIGRAMLLYEKQSSMVRLANLEFEQDPTCPQDLLKVLIKGMSLLQESKTSLDLEPAASLMSKYLAVVNEDIKELSGYIEMVRELI